MKNIILCGSKKYNILNINPIVDYFDFIVRHNMNIPNNNYGTKDSTIQILNIHVSRNYRNLNLLLKQYNDKASNDRIIEFHNYLNRNKNETEVIYFSNNNTQLVNDILRENKINHQMKKEVRCGLSYIPICFRKNITPYLIGYSLIESDYNDHQINNRLKEVNDIGHSRTDEIKCIKELHNKNIIDATFCTLLNEKEPILENESLTPTKNSIDILLKIYDKVEVTNEKKIKNSKLYEFFSIKDNKIYKK